MNKQTAYTQKLVSILAIALLLSATFANVVYADDKTPPQSTPAPGTIEAVKAFVGNNVAITYYGKGISSYAPAIATDVYYVGTDQYEVGISPVRVIQFGPRPLLTTEQPREYDTTDRYTSGELEAMAISFISTHAPGVDIKALIPAYGNKEEVNYFFRWEDVSGKTLVGMRPFIQVGFSRGGDLLSYTNTLGLPALAPTITGDIVYSNGGNYWRQYGPSQYWYYVNGQGWCGKYSTCTPAYMQYTWAGSTKSNYARWDNIDYAQYATLKAFIPIVNSTSTRAPYYVRANGTTYGPYLLNQFNYNDQWVPIVTLNNIQWVELDDNTGETNKQIGFDEIDLIY
ncbi:MAG: hypothetical protein HY022_10465 [Chloroflexi bacterium]|nr:hypothetical protein [Chloroflexota bacterium]